MQFLPQDRVCEFAKLTPIQLLEETEKAVGDPKLPVQHRALVEKSHELKRLEVVCFNCSYLVTCTYENQTRCLTFYVNTYLVGLQTLKQNGETLNQLKALNAEQEKDVERVRQRNQLLAKVACHHLFLFLFNVSQCVCFFHLQAELMKKKLPWLKYDLKKREYKDTLKRETEAKRKLDEAARILNELKAPIEYVLKP